MNRMHSVKIAVHDMNLFHADNLAARYASTRRETLRMAVARGIAMMLREAEDADTKKRLDFEQEAAIACVEKQNGGAS